MAVGDDGTARSLAVACVDAADAAPDDASAAAATPTIGRRPSSRPGSAAPTSMPTPRSVSCCIVPSCARRLDPVSGCTAATRRPTCGTSAGASAATTSRGTARIGDAALVGTTVTVERSAGEGGHSNDSAALRSLDLDTCTSAPVRLASHAPVKPCAGTLADARSHDDPTTASRPACSRRRHRRTPNAECRTPNAERRTLKLDAYDRLSTRSMDEQYQSSN